MNHEDKMTISVRANNLKWVFKEKMLCALISLLESNVCSTWQCKCYLEVSALYWFEDVGGGLAHNRF